MTKGLVLFFFIISQKSICQYKNIIIDSNQIKSLDYLGKYYQIDSLLRNVVLSSFLTEKSTSLSDIAFSELIGNGKFDLQVGLVESKNNLLKSTQALINSIGNINLNFKYPLGLQSNFKNKNFSSRFFIGTTISLSPNLINQDTSYYAGSLFINSDFIIKSRQNDNLIIHPSFSLNGLWANSYFINKIKDSNNNNKTNLYILTNIYFLFKKTYIIGLSYPIVFYNKNKNIVPIDIKFSYNFN